MKRIVVCLLCAVMLMSLSACFRTPGVPETPLPSGTTTAPATPSSKPTSTGAVTTTTTGSSTAATTTTTLNPDIPPVVGFESYPATGWTTDSLIVRDAPSPDGEYIGGLAADHDVTVLEKVGDFYRISYLSSDGWTDQVYINALYVTSVAPPGAE